MPEESTGTWASTQAPLGRHWAADQPAWDDGSGTSLALCDAAWRAAAATWRVIQYLAHSLPADIAEERQENCVQTMVEASGLRLQCLSIPLYWQSLELHQ